MRKFFTLLLLLFSCDVCIYSQTYNSKSDFLTSLSSGYFLNNFNTINNGKIEKVIQSGGTPQVSYTIEASTSGLYARYISDFTSIGTWYSEDNIIITFTSDNVYAVGAEMWLTTMSGYRETGTIYAEFSDGTKESVLSSTSGKLGFIGLKSSNKLTSLTIKKGYLGFINITNLIVSTSFSTGLVNNEFNKITLSPSSITNEFRIKSELEINEVLIINTQGRIVKKTKNNRIIDTSDLSCGLYIIAVYDSNGNSKTFKVIKK